MKITIYCGAMIGNDPEFKKCAAELGTYLGQKGYGLVYGAGKNGLMGTIADSILAAGGKVTGVIPRFLTSIEELHPNLTETIFVDTMDERKMKMVELGNLYLALPGGPGTIEEISEVISWKKLKLHDNPCVLFNYQGYYNPLIAQYDTMVEKGYLTPESRQRIFQSADTLEELKQLIDRRTEEIK